MAVLSSGDRALVTTRLQQDVSVSRETFGVLTKADLRAAVDGLDDYLETNKVAINAAIPLPARTVLTVAQKARLLDYVIRRRYETGA